MVGRMYSFMIAVGDNLEMGLDNHLPWHLPKEVRYFRQVTEYHTIIMGRKTFDSLPRVLPNRKHIVLTGNRDFHPDHPDVTVVHSLEETLALTPGEEEYFVIGGAEIFRLFLPHADKIYITYVHGSFKADTWFPEVDWTQWKEIRRWEAELDEQNPIPHTYYIYEKLKEDKAKKK